MKHKLESRFPGEISLTSDMTNLDNVLKSKDITLLIKVCIVKAMVFPVVMYRYENWTIKMSTKELTLLNCDDG